MAARAVALLVLFVSFLPVTVLAQDLEGAREAYFEADFQTAESRLEGVLAQPTLTREQALQAHRYLVALRFTLDGREAALRHAKAAAALDPAVQPAEGASPEVESLMREAGRALGERAAELRFEVERLAGPERSRKVRVRLDPAPQGLVDVIELRCGVDGRAPVVESGPGPAVELTLEASSTASHCEAEARTEAGAALFEAAETVPGSSVDDAASSGSRPEPLSSSTPPEDEQGDGSSALAWGLGIGGAAAAVAAGIVLAVVLTSGGGGAPNLKTTSVPGWEPP